MAILPTLSIDGVRQAEQNFLTMTVRLSQSSADIVTVDYNTLSTGSATVGTDLIRYIGDPLFGQLSFDPGETVKTLTFYAEYDNLDELDENFAVELSNARGANFGGGNQSVSAIGWILDDDGPGSNRAMAVSDPTVLEGSGNKAAFTISLSEAFATTTTLSYSTQDGSARAGSDYVAKSGTVTFAAGQTEAIVNVDLINDALAEANERFSLNVAGNSSVVGASGEAVILNDDGPVATLSIDGIRQTELNFLTMTVRLSHSATDIVTVDYNTLSNGSATVGTDLIRYIGDPLSGQLSFDPGETVKTLTFYAEYDNLDELDENFAVELSNAKGANFGGGNQSVSAVGWILDDNSPSPFSHDRALAVSDPTVLEGAGNKAAFTISLSEAFATPTTLTYATQDGSARAGSDYVAKSGTVTFAAGQTEATVKVDLIDDALSEANERFSLNVAGTASVAGASGEAAILNDDGPVPTLSIDPVRQTEQNFLTMTVRLSHSAADIVTVDYNTLSTGSANVGTDLIQYIGDPLSGQLSFDPGETGQDPDLLRGVRQPRRTRRKLLRRAFERERRELRRGQPERLRRRLDPRRRQSECVQHRPRAGRVRVDRRRGRRQQGGVRDRTLPPIGQDDFHRLHDGQRQRDRR